MASGEKRRAAAVCDNCGKPHVVYVWTDGTVSPIGTDGSCECDDPEYRVLGREPAQADAAKSRKDAAKSRKDAAKSRNAPSES